MSETLILMSTLAGPGGADAYARSLGLPDRFNGQRCVYGWCEAARVGKFKGDGGRVVSLSAGDLDDLADRHHKLIAAGVNVPVVKDGRESADSVLGYVMTLEREGNTLQALSMFVGDEAAAEAKRCRFGVGLDPDFRDSRSVRYGQAMRHLAARRATSEQLSAARDWRDGGPLPRNPLLDVAKTASGPRAPSALTIAPSPHRGETPAQAFDRIMRLSGAASTAVVVMEPL